MSNATLSIHRFVMCLSALLIAVGVLALSGCSGTPQRETDSASQPSMGAVATKSPGLAEIFVEGASANGDGRVRLGGVEVLLSGQQALDLLAIADAAHDQRDFATQYAAILAAMFAATPVQRQACWERYATLFQELPSTGAAALADLIREDIELAEKHGNGLTNEASVAQQARKSRAVNEYFTAEREYQQAQGYFDDEEALIMAARVRAHAAGAIDHGDSDWQFTLKLDRLLTSTRGDLWETQANAADSTFVGGRAEWHRELNWGRVRARNAIDLYGRGIEPSRRQVNLK